MKVERIGPVQGSDALEIRVSHGEGQAAVFIGPGVLLGLTSGQLIELIVGEVVHACDDALLANEASRVG
jgi:hypothetical protein